jgi:hypothetical protein
LETFRRTLRVTNPVRESLASDRKRVLRPVRVTHRAKRRQRVPRPCDRAPKLPLVASLRGRMCGGRAGASYWPDARWSYRGRRAGRRHNRVLQEPGRPGLSPGVSSGSGDRMVNPWPAVGRLDRRERNDRRAAWYRQAKETKRGERDTGSRTSS